MIEKKARRKKALPRILHGSAFGLVRGVAATANIMGLENSAHFARGIGSLLARMSLARRPDRSNRAIENIRWCFPDATPERARQLLFESYRHLCSLAIELAWTPRLMNEDGFPNCVELGKLADGLAQLLRGGPTVLVTGHAGNWELLGYTMALLGFPMYALYRPLEIEPMDLWLQRTRARRGLILVDKFGASSQLPAIVGANNPVAFIADQNAGDRGLFVPFFNRLASSYKAIALMAMQHNAPVVCGHAVRLSRGLPGAHADDAFRYRLDVIDVIKPDDWVDQPDPAFYISARYRRAIEQMVRRAPEQYLWMHRYWKSRPPHEAADREYTGFPAKLRAKIEALPWITQADIDTIVARSERDANRSTTIWNRMIR